MQILCLSVSISSFLPPHSSPPFWSKHLANRCGNLARNSFPRRNTHFRALRPRHHEAAARPFPLAAFLAASIGALLRIALDDLWANDRAASVSQGPRSLLLPRRRHDQAPRVRLRQIKRTFPVGVCMDITPYPPMLAVITLTDNRIMLMQHGALARHMPRVRPGVRAAPEMLGRTQNVPRNKSMHERFRQRRALDKTVPPLTPSSFSVMFPLF